MSAPATPTHSWRFFRSGGLDQASLETADDLRALATLDQKLWVALSCPVKGLQIDERTLTLIDTDGDGHVRPPEVIAAVSWACARLKDPAALLAGGDALPVEAIGDAAVADAARWIQSRLGKPGPVVTAADAAGVGAALSKGPLKGDGILRPEAGADEATQALIRDVASCCGDVTEPAVDAFYSDLAAFKAWSRAAGSTAPASLGPAAAEAFEAVAAVRSKVADYFARTALAAFDGAAASGLNRREEDFRAIAGGELASDSPVIASLPLARVEASRPLPLLEGVNPAWSAALARLHESAVVPLLGAGKASLTASDWAALGEKLRPYEAWIGTRPTSPVAKLGLERIDAILGGPGRRALGDLFAEDRLLAPRVGVVADVERLALLYRDLGTILRNFVNFSDFYSQVEGGHLPGRHALPGQPLLQAVHPGGGLRRARVLRRHEPSLRRLRRVPQAGRPVDEARRRVHPGRQRLPFRRAKRRLLRPLRPGLGRDDRQDLRHPHQHPPVLPLPVQEGLRVRRRAVLEVRGLEGQGGPGRAERLVPRHPRRRPSTSTSRSSPASSPRWASRSAPSAWRSRASSAGSWACPSGCGRSRCWPRS